MTRNRRDGPCVTVDAIVFAPRPLDERVFPLGPTPLVSQ